MENIEPFEPAFMVFKMINDRGQLELVYTGKTREDALNWLKESGKSKQYYTITEVFRKQ